MRPLTRLFLLVAGVIALAILFSSPHILFALPFAVGVVGVNTQVEDANLRELFEDYIAEMTNNRNRMGEIFKPETADFAGKSTEYRGNVGRNTSPSFVGEDTAFADAGSQAMIPVRIDQRKMMGRIRMTSEVMYDSRKSEAAYVSTKKNEMGRIIDDMARREEYAMCTDGRGVLALIDEASPNGDVTLELDAPGGIANDNFGNRFIFTGMYIGAVNPATGALRAGICKVIACNSDGTDVTTDAAPNAAWTNNDYIVHAANSSVTDVLDTSYEHAFMGVMGLFDDGTYRNNYFGVDRSVYGNYSSYVKPTTGVISTDLFQQVSDIVDQKLNGRIDKLVCHHDVRRIVIQMTDPDRRYLGNGKDAMSPDPGTVAFKQEMDLTMGEVPIIAIRDFALDVLLLLDTQGCEPVRYVSEKGKWVDEDGSILVRAGVGSSARDAFEAWYRRRYQNHVRQPGKCARLDGITVSNIVVRAE